MNKQRSEQQQQKTETETNETKPMVRLGIPQSFSVS